MREGGAKFENENFQDFLRYCLIAVIKFRASLVGGSGAKVGLHNPGSKTVSL